MNKSEMAERAQQFYNENATNVVNVPRPGHPEDKSGWDGVRRASEAKFIARDALVMTLPDAIDFAVKFVERAIAESQAWISVEEKLPEHRDEQILTVTRKKRVELQSAVFWRYLPDSYDPVTHWAHLPDPPKGNENV